MQANSLLDQTRRLHDDSASGVLALSRDGQRVEVFYREGAIEAVSSNLELHRLGRYLAKEGYAQPADLEALHTASRRQRMLLGEAAVRKALLEPGDLAEVVRLQAFELLDHAIRNDFLPTGFTVGFRSFYAPARIRYTHLLLELSRRDRTPFQMDAARRVMLSSGRDLSELPWYPQEVGVLAELRHPNTIPGLLASTGMQEDTLLRILGVFQRLGVIQTLDGDALADAASLDETSTAVAKKFVLEELVPIVTNAVTSEKVEVLRNSSSFISEQFRNLKVRVGQMDSATPLKVISVSSSESEEGKSLISANLAFSFSLDPGRRVVLVDCDLRNPSLNKYLGVPHGPGLVEYLTESTLSPYCYLRRSENLYFLTGGIAANPIELLSLGKMKRLIEHLKADFDTIILDAPPFAPIADGRIVSDLSDGLILVVRRRKTSYSGLENTLNLVDRKKLLGVVFNDVKPEAFNTSYHYGHQYSRYVYSGGRKPRVSPKNYLQS